MASPRALVADPVPTLPPAPRPDARTLRVRRARNIAMALALGGLCILFYVVTFVKGAAVLVRPA